MTTPTKYDWRRAEKWAQERMDETYMGQTPMSVIRAIEEIKIAAYAQALADERARIVKMLRQVAEVDRNASPDDRVDAFFLVNVACDFIEGKSSPWLSDALEADHE